MVKYIPIVVSVVQALWITKTVNPNAVTSPHIIETGGGVLVSEFLWLIA